MHEPFSAAAFGGGAMNRNIAVRAMMLIKMLDFVCVELDVISDQIEHVAEKKRIKRLIGTLVMDAHEHLVRHIARDHPDLDPDAGKKFD